VVRGGYNEAAVVNGIAFAKRKKPVFKGPMLSGVNKRDSTGSRMSQKRSGGGNIIEEEEEEEEEMFEEDNTDEVALDEFGPELSALAGSAESEVERTPKARAASN
jgi:hypothetical protein